MMSKYKTVQSPVDSRDYTRQTVGLQSVELPATYEPEKRMHVKWQNWSSCCVGFSICTAMEYCEQKLGLKPNSYSMGMVYLNRNNEDLDVVGMYTRKALKILQKEGTCQYHEYRWAHNTHDVLFEIGKGKEEKLEPLAAPYKIKSYFALKSIEEIKQTVYQEGACVCCYPVFHPFENVLTVPEKGERERGRHAVTCVGWNEEGFILQDSYSKLAHIGSPVGAGFFLLPFEYYENMKSRLEFWGIQIDPETPRKPASEGEKTINVLYPIVVPFVEAWHWIKVAFQKLRQKLGNI